MVAVNKGLGSQNKMTPFIPMRVNPILLNKKQLLRFKSANVNIYIYGQKTVLSAFRIISGNFPFQFNA